jgi:hypothetical protein
MPEDNLTLEFPMSQSLDSYWPLVEPMFDAVSIDDLASFERTKGNVPRSSLVLFAAHFCLSEVWNGGLMQFFWNSTGILAPEAIEGFQVIGMPKLANRLAAAASPLGEVFPRDRQARWDAMLVNSGLDIEQLEQIFRVAKDQYLAFMSTTAAFEWDRLTEEIYTLAENENGGFQNAATDFANRNRQ